MTQKWLYTRLLKSKLKVGKSTRTWFRECLVWCRNRVWHHDLVTFRIKTECTALWTRPLTIRSQTETSTALLSSTRSRNSIWTKMRPNIHLRRSLMCPLTTSVTIGSEMLQSPTCLSCWKSLKSSTRKTLALEKRYPKPNQMLLTYLRQVCWRMWR